MRNEAKRGPAITRDSIIINQGERRLRTTRKQNYAAILRTFHLHIDPWPVKTQNYAAGASWNVTYTLEEMRSSRGNTRIEAETMVIQSRHRETHSPTIEPRGLWWVAVLDRILIDHDRQSDSQPSNCQNPGCDPVTKWTKYGILLSSNGCWRRQRTVALRSKIICALLFEVCHCSH